ncbi:MAG: type II toxin-antitoxin system YafQ family toxin [Clostridia bacterium]
MLDVFYSSKFKKDYKLAKKQGKDMELLLDIVDILQRKALTPKHKDHPLSGDYIGHRGYIQPSIGY